MATSKRPRSRSKDRNIFIGLGIAAIIVIAAIYYEAPAVIGTASTSTSTTSTSSGPIIAYPTEYGSLDGWAAGIGTGIASANASALAENEFTYLPTQTTPFLSGGSSRQVALSGYTYVANVGNYELYGQDIETQNEIYDVPLPNSPIGSLPYVTPFFHIEATTTVGNSPEVWVSTPWDGIYAFPYVAAQHANYGFNVTVPSGAHNIGTYSEAAPNFVIDGSRGVMVTGLMVNTTSSSVPGRGFVQGWKLGTNNATLSFSQTQITVKSSTNLWTTYLSPPQDGSDPGWELSQMNSIPHVWEFNGTSALDLKTLSASALQSLLSNDWTAQSGNATFSAGPETNSSWIADSATGTTYITTSAPQTVSLDNSFNGPAIFSSSIIALNTTSGSILWTFQMTPHDVWGWGCKGNLALVSATIGGTSEQVLAKQCENGYLFLLNPSTGALLYAGQIPGVVRPSSAQIPNIQNQTEMKASLASLTGANSTQMPIIAYGTNIAYDSTNSLLLGAVGPYATPLGGQVAVGSKWNSTAYAFDLNHLAWEWHAPLVDQTVSYITVANGIVYIGTYQGEIYVANTVTGSLFMDIHAAIAVTSMIVMAGIHGQYALAVSGYSISTKQQVELLTYTPGGL